MSLDSSAYRYTSMVSHGKPRNFAILSVLFHVGLVAIALCVGLFMPSGSVLLLGTGGGGKGGGLAEGSIGVGMVGELPAGEDFYKAPARTLEAAAQGETQPPVEETKPEEKPETKVEKEPVTPQKDEFVTETAPNKKPKPTPAAAPRQTPTTTRSGAVASSSSPVVGTAEKAVGVHGGTAPAGSGSTGGGFGTGSGVSLGNGSGSGGGGGIYDSWYARQVEMKVGSNWLKSRMGVQFSGQHRVVIQFDVTADGHIEGITIIQSTGPEAFERSAIRAVKASETLPPIPSQYRMQFDRVRFEAVFEYPIPK